MKRMRYSIFCLVFICLTAPIYGGIVYYIDGANGNDSNPGTQTLPWKTIQKAADIMIAGDAVFVSAGIYPERITVSNSGSAGSLIYFLADGTVECQGFTVIGNYIRVRGFTVTGDQPTWGPEGYGIWVEGNFCTIDDNYAYHSQRGGINLRPQSANCIVRNNRCFRNGMAGMEIHGTNHIVENNDVWGSIAIPPQDIPESADADGIRFFGSGHIFRGNYIHDIKYEDPENTKFNPGIDAFQTWGDANHASASNILIDKNFIYLPGYKAKWVTCNGFMFRDCRYIVIRNNIVITHGGTNTVGGNVEHLTIINNTVIGSLSYLASNDPAGIILTNCPNSTVKNNIVYDQASWAISLEGTTYTGLDIGNNCTYNSDGSIPFGTPYPQDLWGINPLFVNPAHGDYHLKTGSPCIDAGATLADVTDDYDHNARPAGTAYDIGAFECTAPAITTQPQSQTIHIGQTASMNITAAGSAPLSYQWYQGISGNPSNPISGATSSLYTTNPLTRTTNYWVRVSNTYGNTDSDTATITVLLTPIVTTTAVSAIMQTGAVSGGDVVSDGGSAVTERGLCWSTSSDPTIDDAKTTRGGGTGPFKSMMTGLTPNTTYHVRAYATNSEGTAYGSDITFKTSSGIRKK